MAHWSGRTYYRYARAALANPGKVLGKLGLVSSRLRQRIAPSAPRDVTGLTVSPHLGLDRLLNDLGAVLPVVVLARDVRTAHIGLPADRALDVLHALSVPDGTLDIYVQGRRVVVGLKSAQRSIQTAGCAQIVFGMKQGGHAVLTVDLYEDRGGGTWVSFNAKNTIARALYDWDFRTVGLRVIPHNRPQPRDVDVVFSWVNHADPNWQAMFADHEPTDQSTTDNRASARFHDNGELRHGMRAVARLMPWTRTIFVVSNCKPPDWLDPDAAGVVWVDHADILPADVLPTFNSHAIETALHKIPDLSEDFIYFNDDMLVMRPLDRDWFFNANGTSRAHIEPYGMVTGAVTDGAQDYLNAARNGAALILDKFGVWPTQLHRHVPYALRRSVLRNIEETFSIDIARTRKSRFRGRDDVSMVSFLYHHFARQTGGCTFEDTDAVNVKSSDLRWRDDLARAQDDGCDVICLNEGGHALPEPHWRTTVARVLTQMVPWVAPWER